MFKRKRNRLTEEELDFFPVEDDEEIFTDDFPEPITSDDEEEDDTPAAQTEEDLLESDLFDEDDSITSHPKKRKSGPATAWYFIIAILLIVLCALLFLLYRHFQEMSVSEPPVVQQEKDQYAAYQDLINGVALPEGWSQEDFDKLKQDALNAYDRSTLNLISQLESGSDTVRVELEQLNNPSAQPGIEPYKKLFGRLNEIPAGIAALTVKDPSMIDFVLSWQPGMTTEIVDQPLTESLETLPDLKTFDERWAFMEYGDGILASSGSAPVALSSVFSYVTDNPALTPVTLAEYAKAWGYDVDPTPAENSSLFAAAAMNFGVAMTPIPTDTASINANLATNSPVIIAVGSGTGRHYEVITGVDENGNWLVQDPSSSNGVTAVSPDTLTDITEAYAFW